MKSSDFSSPTTSSIFHWEILKASWQYRRTLPLLKSPNDRFLYMRPQCQSACNTSQYSVITVSPETWSYHWPPSIHCSAMSAWSSGGRSLISCSDISQFRKFSRWLRTGLLILCLKIKKIIAWQVKCQMPMYLKLCCTVSMTFLSLLTCTPTSKFSRNWWSPITYVPNLHIL